MLKILVADNHEDGMFKCRGELLDRLVEIGEVHISVPEGKYTNKLVQKGCIFEKIAIDRHGMNPFQEIKLIREYSKLLNKIEPDIVLTYSIKPNAYLGMLCSVRSIPYIANITGLGIAINNKGLYQNIVLFLYKLGLRKASKVFFQNKENCDFIIKHKIYTGNYDIIPGSGVNLQAHKFEDYPKDTPALNFLTIGRIMKDKGIDELLAAAKMVKEQYPDVHFYLMGFFDGDYEEKIQEAERKNIIEFLGYQDDVHYYISKSHAIIHPSYHEGMANALLESASAGRPVIATDVAGCLEAFTPGVTGLACKAKDAESLSEAIISFIKLPYAKKIEMGKAARKKMEAEFSRNIVIDKYLETIKNNVGVKKIC